MTVLIQLIKHFRKIGELHWLYFNIVDSRDCEYHYDTFIHELNLDYGIELSDRQTRRFKAAIDRGNYNIMFERYKHIA